MRCNNNYDPYNQQYSGFIGGKSETAFILIVWSVLMWSALLMLCYTFSTQMATDIPKTISIRNRHPLNGISEPGFAGKIVASVGVWIYTISRLRV
ncbi:unnamed protein product [Medioppia subpectinata]|uniref:Uncharacterized protein n=1 Tax=Medioppia subpectinata TaxID=1979941 RepID=A0A7R9Q215_9ACAR|nr:unnamed protein product [Medioppia subpectinata]CAG2109840.1 unnamed protein product [Medioppia subpectinata]